jgi:hypothetical protein
MVTLSPGASSLLEPLVSKIKACEKPHTDKNRSNWSNSFFDSDVITVGTLELGPLPIA